MITVRSKHILRGYLVIYLLVLIWWIVFKLDLPSKVVFFQERRLNLIPFSEIMKAGMLWDVILNFLVFIPFGLLTASLSSPWKERKGLLYACIVSLIFEASQYTFAIGACDTTDVATNTLGAGVGIVLFKLLIRICRKKEKAEAFLVWFGGLCGIGILSFCIRIAISF